MSNDTCCLAHASKSASRVALGTGLAVLATPTSLHGAKLQLSALHSSHAHVWPASPSTALLSDCSIAKTIKIPVQKVSPFMRVERIRPKPRSLEKGGSSRPIGSSSTGGGSGSGSEEREKEPTALLAMPLDVEGG